MGQHRGYGDAAILGWDCHTEIDALDRIYIVWALLWWSAFVGKYPIIATTEQRSSPATKQEAEFHT